MFSKINNFLQQYLWCKIKLPILYAYKTLIMNFINIKNPICKLKQSWRKYCCFFQITKLNFQKKNKYYLKATISCALLTKVQLKSNVNF